MRLILVGPSHIPRIRHALEVVRLPRPADEILYLGDGGFPIWKKSVFEQCRTEYRKGDTILLIVADFRFGNSILEDESYNISDSVFFDGHTHVKRDLCTLDNDERMKTLCVNAINGWSKQFGDGLIVFHWTLAMRTVKNRLSRQHIDSQGKYHHPVWNIDDPVFRSDVTGLSALQTSNDLGIFNSLTIDNDLHPSTLGYLYIIAYATTEDHETALSLAKTIYMAGINTLSTKFYSVPPKRCVICGTSKVISSLLKMLPLISRNRLSAAGIDIIAPEEVLQTIISRNDISKILYISSDPISNQEDLTVSIAQINNKIKGSLNVKLDILFWDAIATHVMQWRARSHRNAPTGLIEKKLAANIFRTFWSEPASDFEFQTIDRLIEYGAGGAPTFWGILSILNKTADTPSDDIPNAVMNDMRASAAKNSLVLKKTSP